MTKDPPTISSLLEQIAACEKKIHDLDRTIRYKEDERSDVQQQRAKLCEAIVPLLQEQLARLIDATYDRT